VGSGPFYVEIDERRTLVLKEEIPGGYFGRKGDDNVTVLWQPEGVAGRYRVRIWHLAAVPDLVEYFPALSVAAPWIAARIRERNPAPSSADGEGSRA
jgi:hypothetical protein